MVAIPEPINHTVSAIWDTYEKRANEGRGDNYGVPIGNLGHECDRSLWYQLRWASARERIDGPKQRRFDTGNLEEERLIADLRAAGIKVTDADPATGSQYRIALCNGWLRGKLDATAVDIPEAPVTEHVVECKSHNDKSFKELLKKGLKAGKFDHWVQCQIYMHGMNLTRCLYIAVNKNDDHLYTERVRIDKTFCQLMEARVLYLVKSVQAPPRAWETPIHTCNWCPAKPQCHEKAFARKNCRTCLSFDYRDEGVGYCTYFDHELDYEMQQRGCPQHLYLPSLVPGEQIDTNVQVRSVTYLMPDGSTWIDGPLA